MTMIQPSWHDLQYLPSLTVKDAASVVPEWWKRAAATRQRFAPMGDIKYGAHPREVLDLFRVENARGTLIYIHGGYWRSFSKLETSWVADGFLEQGFSVALINYPLCPDVSLAQIRSSVLSAFAYLYRNVLNESEKRNIVVTGHSAGGHLAALHLATDWRDHKLPQNPIAGVISLSGVFDVAPLLRTSLNADLHLTEQTAQSLNLMSIQPKSNAKLVLAVGALESEEFHRQSTDIAKSWASLAPQLVDVPDLNHYTIVDSLAAKDGVLHGLACDMLNG
jgi:arylformamidase